MHPADTLASPIRIGGTVIRNRLYRAPVLEGAGDGDDAAETYARHFVENARHGVGLIIQGSSCLMSEGRTSPGMTCVDTRAKVLRLATMVDAVHRAGAAIFLQVGHGGLYAMEAWHEPYASNRRGPILAASPVPWLLRPAFRGVPVHVMTTEDVRTMIARYGDVAAWAREAGYDGIELGSANAKLLDQFLSPFYNRRTDEFGGSPERRAGILRDIRAAVRERAGADFPCTVKVPAETAPPGFPRATTDDALRLCRLVEEWGFDAITPVEVSVFPDTTLSRGAVPDSFWTNPGIAERLKRAAPSRRRRAVIKAGAWWGGRRAPFTPVWNRPLFTAAKRTATIPVLAVGGIRRAEEAHAIVDRGEADLVGIGRPFYAEPDLAARILRADDSPGRCRSSNRCVAAQMLGMRGVCYNPDVVKSAELVIPAPRAARSVRGVPDFSKFLIKSLTRVHETVFRVSGGRLLGRGAGMPVLMLTTTGRKSGQRRTTMLTTPLQDGDRLLLVASNGGNPRHPDWFLNLRDDPHVEVTMHGRGRPMTAHVADPTERAQLWPRIVADHANYGDYQNKTDRDIPVVVLEPASTGSPNS